jgi:hypothetical protein
MESGLVKSTVFLFSLLLLVLFLIPAREVHAASTTTGGPCTVILVPGAFGVGKSSLFLSADDYFSDYEKFFKEKGCVVRKIEYPPNVTIEVRARFLRDQTRESTAQNGGVRAVIVAHSQGALDARFALKSLGLASVSALISIGAPNYGTPIADWVISHRDSKSILYWVLRLGGNYDLKGLPFVGEMTEAFLKQHAENFSQVTGVKYASARGACRTDCHWSLRLLNWLSGGRGGLSSASGGDGMIPAERQSFGEDLGEYDLDHISEVGHDAAKLPERTRFLEKLVPYLR